MSSKAVIDWLGSRPSAGGSENAEKQLEHMLSLKLLGSEADCQGSRQEEAGACQQDLLFWIPSKPQKRGLALNTQFKWQSQPRKASQVSSLSPSVL